MATIPHGLRSWWRYTGLTVIPFGADAVVTMCFWAAALSDGWPTVPVVLAAVMTVALAVWFIAGAAKAERARRHGCW